MLLNPLYVDHKEAGMSVGACRTSWEASPAKRAGDLDVAAAEGPTATQGTCSRGSVTTGGHVMTQQPRGRDLKGQIIRFSSVY